MTGLRLSEKARAGLRDMCEGLPAIHPDDVDESPEGSDLRSLHAWAVEERRRRRKLWNSNQDDLDRVLIMEEAKRRWPWAWREEDCETTAG